MPPASPKHTRPPALFPPVNFNAVEEGLYRSGMPFELNFEFLKTLKLRTVVVLSSHFVDEALSGFFEEQGINVVYGENAVSVSDTLRGVVLPFAEEMVIETLKVLSNKINYPVLVTCKTGKTLTGVVVACLRKLCRWSLISIYEEFRRYAGGSRLQQQHEQFVELFDTDLVPIGDCAPSFLQA
ncbi:protein-tyrosine phosphatase [Ochromonadaceae sp. CCMP2298]|nr:protein-tyrosine phosphatase [Ochromonadaceae sp. CCMP2298]